MAIFLMFWQEIFYCEDDHNGVGVVFLLVNKISYDKIDRNIVSYG